MNIDRTGYVDLLYADSGPLCPNDFMPRSREHQLATDIGDDVYKAAEPTRDEESCESPPEIEGLIDAAYRGRHANARMHLYRDEVTAKDHRGLGVAVEALFFRCRVCGLILPASRTPRAVPYA